MLWKIVHRQQWKWLLTICFWMTDIIDSSFLSKIEVVMKILSICDKKLDFHALTTQTWLWCSHSERQSPSRFMLKIHTLDVASFHISVPIECHMGLELFIYDEQVNSLWGHLSHQLQGSKAWVEEVVSVLAHLDGSKPVLYRAEGVEVRYGSVQQWLRRPGEGIGGER